MGFLSGLFGGGNSSSSSTTQTTQIDKRQVVDGNGVGVSSDSSTVNVSQLDGGAINTAFQFAGYGLDSAANLMLETIRANRASEQAALKFATKSNDNAMNFAFDAGKPDASLMQNYAKYIAAAVGLIGIALVWKMGK